MTLYKFVGSRDAVINMVKGSLKFTPLKDLNDPSELTPVMDLPAVRASLHVLRRTGFSEEQYRWLVRQDATLALLAPHLKALDVPQTCAEASQLLSLPVYDNFEYMQKQLFSAIEAIRSGIGILSLTQRYDSLPMWAHYAAQAKGFVVVFEDLDICFPGDATGSLNMPKEVMYCEEFRSMTFDPSTQDRLFFSKLTDWSYEREVRIVSALSSCRQEAGRLYLRNIHPLHITGVICGWNVCLEDRQWLKQKLIESRSNANLIRASLAGSKVHLDKNI